MNLSTLYQANRTIFSFEIFPPKKDSSKESLSAALLQLKNIRPDFISVTYGAGGNAADSTTEDLAALCKQQCGIEPVAHLTCVNNDKQEIDAILERFRSKGIENILALRGDINPSVPPKNDFRYASDLIAYIAEKGGFNIAAACYPEVHPEAVSEEEDLENLKRKVDCGASLLISQLFFDNEIFYRFLDKVRAKGIHAPIEAGIMPVVNSKQIKRIVELSGATFPRKFRRILERYGDYPEALRDAGIAYAIDQIVDLVANGVDGVHLYIMNNPYVAQKINNSVINVMQAGKTPSGITL
jgi:methylenetetrahydrofolate reductase (NADPH)